VHPIPDRAGTAPFRYVVAAIPANVGAVGGVASRWTVTVPLPVPPALVARQVRVAVPSTATVLGPHPSVP